MVKQKWSVSSNTKSSLIASPPKISDVHLETFNMACQDDSCVSELSSTLTRLRLSGQNNFRDAQGSSDLLEPSNPFMVNSAGVETLMMPGSSVPSISTISLDGRSGCDGPNFQIPIIGYEVMEERARFTVYKLRIESNTYGDCWFVFRRYTDFDRLYSKLKSVFPSANLRLPGKRWFGNNFDCAFLEERLLGLQAFINRLLDHPEMCRLQFVRDFFCLDEPPSYVDATQESRPIFDALDETIDRLRHKLREAEWEIQQLKAEKAFYAQDRAELCQLVRNSTKICNQCKPEIEVLLAGESTKVTSKRSPCAEV